MITRRNTSLIFFGLITFLLINPVFSQYGVNGDLTKKPNILFIFADDHSPRTVAALGNTVIKTPALDSLANAGMVFTNIYNQGAAGGAVCVSSRLMLNTGRYYNPNNTPAPGNSPYWGKAMQDLGYDTYESGKWHNGNTMLAASFENHNSTTGCACGESNQTGAAYFRPYGQGGTAQNPTVAMGNWDPANEVDGHYANSQNFGNGKHSSVAISEQAIDYMQQHIDANNNKPFFIYMAFNAPHDFRQAPQKYQDMYAYPTIDFTPNYMPDHPFDNGHMGPGLRDEKLGNFPRDSLVYRQQRSEYYAIITHMDDQIRIVLDSLETKGLKDNTYIIYTADHGLAVGEHGLLGKQNLYEHSVKVPFFVIGPGIQSGTQSDAMFYLQNAFATSVEMAGGPIPQSVQFQSVVDVLNGTTTKGRDEIYFRYRDHQRAVRTEFYKVIVYFNGADHVVQLFRLKDAPVPATANDYADPYEIRDLSKVPEYSEVLSGLLRKLEDEMVNIGGELNLPSNIDALKLPVNQSRLFLDKDTMAVRVFENHARSIKFSLDAITHFTIFNVEGILVTTLYRPKNGFSKKFKWNGMVQGKKASSGVYNIFAMKNQQVMQIQKMIFK